MRITFSKRVTLQLMTHATLTRGMEFSGFGFVKIKGKKKDIIEIYDFVLLDIGNEVFTEIPIPVILKLMDRPDAKNMKAWIHRHPIGNGIPGWHNWSGTDNNTIATAPLGGLPDMVKWSISCVLTPLGWVGRYDNYLKRTTKHLHVTPQVHSAYQEFACVQAAVRARTPQATFAPVRSRTWQEYDPIDDFHVGIVQREYVEKFVDQNFSAKDLRDYGLTREEMIEYTIMSVNDGDTGMMDVESGELRKVDFLYQLTGLEA